MHHCNHMYLGLKYILFTDLERSVKIAKVSFGKNGILWNIGISSNMLINY